MVRGDMGFLPRPLMSNVANTATKPGWVLAHEFGHLRHAWDHPVLLRTAYGEKYNNAYAVHVENMARRLTNPNGPTRRIH